MTQPKLLLLDEPSSGLDVRETASLADKLAVVQAQHEFAVLLVEHDVEMVSNLVTRLYVLDFGELIAAGPTEDVLGDDAVRKAYLGRHGVTTEHAGRDAAPRAARRRSQLRALPRPCSACRSPSRSRASPRSSAATGRARPPWSAICSGLLHPTGGQLLYQGEDVSQMRAYKLARLGVVHAPEGRSVFATLSVEENLALTFRQVFGRRGCRAAIDQSYELFPRLGERRRQLAGTLSGGRAAHAVPRPGARPGPEAAHHRRALARPGARHHRRGVRDARHDPTRAARRCSSSSSTSTRR